jgi:hypothetical protein
LIFSSRRSIGSSSIPRVAVFVAMSILEVVGNQ